MHKIAISILAFLMVGCPSPASTPSAKVKISTDCLLEYSVALIDAAESEANACEALRKSTWLDETQPADLLHAIVWENPSDKLLQKCGGWVQSDGNVKKLPSEAVRLRLLDKDVRFRARCAMSCPWTGDEKERSNCD